MLGLSGIIECNTMKIVLHSQKEIPYVSQIPFANIEGLKIGLLVKEFWFCGESQTIIWYNMRRR